MIPLLLALSSAQAGTCSVEALSTELEEASPMGVPRAFHALYECDADAAAPLAPAALSRALPSDDANQLVLDALALGLEDEIRAWIGGLRSDERSGSIKALGEACVEHEAVAAFLVTSEAAIGEDFWSQRWYRSLGECRRPEVQALLKAEVQAPSGDRNRFLSVLEVFARNLGADALPYLKTLLVLNEREDEAGYIVNAFADAANVGSMDGMNAETAALAVTALFELAPQMPEPALKQAAITLETLGAGDRAGELAGAHFRDRIWEDGQLHYGLVVVETATCKKGKVQVVLHQSELVEPGRAWLAELDVDELVAGWSYTLQADCKGTASETVVRVSAQPLLDPSDIAGYQRAIRSEIAATGPAKLSEVVEAPIGL